MREGSVFRCEDGGLVTKGQMIDCISCAGHGLVTAMSGEPDECRDCGGSGKNWQYPSGAIARYYGGPFIGFDTPPKTSRPPETPNPERA